MYSAECILVHRQTVDIFKPKVVQATMGSVFRVPFCYADLTVICRKAISLNGRTYGTFLDGNDLFSRDLDKGDTAPSIIIIGNESRGISAPVAAEVSDRLLIPRTAGRKSESLNASVAAAITMCEFRRS